MSVEYFYTLGEIYTNLKDFKLSLKNFTSALETGLFNSVDDFIVQNIYASIANVYFSMAQYEEALKRISSALNLAKKHYDTISVIELLIKQAYCHIYLGKNVNPVLILEEAAGLARVMNYYIPESNILINMGKGLYYDKYGDYKNAARYLSLIHISEPTRPY